MEINGVDFRMRVLKSNYVRPPFQHGFGREVVRKDGEILDIVDWFRRDIKRALGFIHDVGVVRFKKARVMVNNNSPQYRKWQRRVQRMTFNNQLQRISNYMSWHIDLEGFEEISAVLLWQDGQNPPRPMSTLVAPTVAVNHSIEQTAQNFLRRQQKSGDYWGSPYYSYIHHDRDRPMFEKLVKGPDSNIFLHAVEDHLGPFLIEQNWAIADSEDIFAFPIDTAGSLENMRKSQVAHARPDSPVIFEGSNLNRLVVSDNMA